MSVRRILEQTIKADVEDSTLQYDMATIADRLESVEENLSILATEEARVQMLQALAGLWTPRPGGCLGYNTPQYNAIEIVVLAIRDLVSEYEVSAVAQYEEVR